MASGDDCARLSGRTPGDGGKASVEATLDDLPTVATTSPLLRPVGATITLDEEPLPAPSATQLLEPVAEVPTDLKLQVPGQVIGVSETVTTRRKGPLKADAFESAPSLAPARKEEAPVLRGAPAPWERARVWTPGLIVLTLVGVAMALVGLYVLLQG